MYAHMYVCAVAKMCRAWVLYAASLVAVDLQGVEGAVTKLTGTMATRLHGVEGAVTKLTGTMAPRLGHTP